jgi:hypothetical protein
MHERLYRFLFSDEDARVCKDIPDSACDDQPRNFITQIAALTLTKTGDQFMDPKITLSWLLTTLGAPSLFLSLLVPVHNTFSLLPQMLVAYLIRRAPVRKWFWSAGSVGQGITLLFMCYVALNFEGAQAGFWIIFLLFVFSLCRGVCSVAQKDVLGKTVAKTRRGRVSGYSESVAGVLTLGLAVYLMLSEQRTVEVVVAILLIAALLWLASALVFAGVAEQPGATEGGANGIQEAWQQFSVIRTNAEFRKFVLVRSALLGSALMAPYLVALAQNDAGSALTVLGSLLMAGSLASFVSGATWGSLADSSSARCMTIAGSLAALSGFTAIVLVSLEMANMVVFALCVFTLYLAHAGVRVGRKTHLVDMANEDNRSTLVAVSNTLIGIMLLLFAGVGAVVSQFHAFAGLGFFSALALAGALMATSLEQVQQKSD